MNTNNKVADNKNVKPLMIDIDTVQREYLQLSKKKIRNIANTYLRTIRCGNKILIDRMELEKFIKDPERDHLI